MQGRARRHFSRRCGESRKHEIPITNDYGNEILSGQPRSGDPRFAAAVYLWPGRRRPVKRGVSCAE